ncbi:unnamed protein product [Durusdinium trenchii]|uniref:N-acetylgalactosamine-6-O-sulfatase n=2 Tax=Durusdinium trenchii TaxID=1381693 RepID=A0ABP0QRS7_9DINO
MLRLSWAPALCVAALQFWSLALARKAPNMIWIMADDLGWGEVGLYPAESPHGRIATPNLDQFGREGVRFQQAYAGYTVCAPSRTTFFTGRHSGHFRALQLNGEELKPEQNFTLLPQLFQRAGFRTGAFGKLAPLVSPLRQGFDVFVGQVDQALCHNMYPKEIDTGDGTLNFKLSGNIHSPSPTRERCMQSPDSYNYTIDVFHKEAMSWMRQVAQTSQPFFLYLSYTVPHAGGWGDAPASPEQGNPVPTDMGYGHQPWPEVEKDHAAVISYLDDKVGDVMKQLKALKIDEKTMVFFASDNGAHLEGGHQIAFFNSTGGLSGHKRSMYEGGVRSPTMVRWPQQIRPRTSQFAWAFWDMVPTVAELLGVTAPENDGISILPELYGQEQQEHDYLFFTWIGEGRSGGLGPANGDGARNGPGYTVRKGVWKGLVPHCHDTKNWRPSWADEMKLFDLESDPTEQRDWAKARPELVDELKRLVMAEGLSCMCYQCGFSDDVMSSVII